MRLFTPMFDSIKRGVWFCCKKCSRKAKVDYYGKGFNPDGIIERNWYDLRMVCPTCKKKEWVRVIINKDFDDFFVRPTGEVLTRFDNIL